MKKFASLAALCVLLPLPAAVAGFSNSLPLVYVSGVGDDANPGTRTAPVKTLSGAFSKADAQAEIDILDPVNLGLAIITRSVTVDGRGSLSAVTVANSNIGLTVDGGVGGIVVTLRNLQINGFSNGLTGIKAIGRVTLRLVNCDIFGVTGAGVDFQGADGSTLSMENCRLHDCAGGGVLLRPSVANNVQGSIMAILDTVSISHCGTVGVDNQAGARSYLREVQCRNIGGAAFNSAAGTSLSISNSIAALSTSGVAAAGAVFLTDSEIVANTGAGLATSGSGRSPVPGPTAWPAIRRTVLRPARSR